MNRKTSLTNEFLLQFNELKKGAKTPKALVIPPKKSGVHAWNFLGILTEEILNEDETIQRRADHALTGRRLEQSLRGVF